MAENLSRISEQLRKDDTPDRIDGIPVPENEAEAIADRVDAAIALADTKADQATGSTKIRDLDGDTAGLYTFASRKREIDTTCVMTMTKEEIAHVLLHEDGHRMNHANSNDERIISVDFEEGLNELRTTRALNDEAMAYHDEITQVKSAANKTGVSVTKLISWYEQGENSEINNVIQQASNNKASSQAMAA